MNNRTKDNAIEDTQSISNQPEVGQNQSDRSISNNIRKELRQKRNKTVYYPKSFEGDSGDGAKGGSTSNDTEIIIEPPDYQESDDKVNQQGKKNDQNKKSRNDLLKRYFPDILKAIGNKAIKESPPSLQELKSMQ